MNVLSNLRQLAISDTPANRELVKQMTSSPDSRLYKYRGVLRICKIRKEIPNDQSPGGGILAMISNHKQCHCQARAKCTCCKQYTCSEHFDWSKMECTACCGSDSHYYAIPFTAEMMKRVMHKAILDFNSKKAIYSLQ